MKMPGEVVRGADGKGVAEAQLEQPTVPAAMTLGKPEDGRARDQEQADERWPLAEVGVEEGLQRGAQQRRRHDRDDEEPGQPSLRVAGQRAISQARRAS